MPPKRKYNNKARKVYRKYGRKATVAPAARTLQAAVRRVLAKNLEIKNSCFSTTDGTEIGHNSFIILDNALLKTTQGIDSGNTNDTTNRIGDKINLKSIQLKMMVELNERYSDVTFRCLVIKSSKGDTITSSSLFNGLSSNKMLDTINTERYTILKQKWFKLTARNNGVVSGASSVPGYSQAGNLNEVSSRATKIIKFTLPYSKFSKSGIITYEDGTSQVKFFDYTVILYAYSNYSTSDLLGYNVGRLNDYIAVMKYTDA